MSTTSNEAIEAVARVGWREGCPKRSNGRPHTLLSGRFGGAFCRACNKSFGYFHVHDGSPCDCRPSRPEPAQ